MGLLPSAPRVDLRVPAAIFLGQPATLEIDVTAKATTKIDFIKVRVRGVQGWQVGSGKSSVSHRVIYPELELRLAGPGVLEPGTVEYQTTFTLPHDAAPTHNEGAAYARLEAVVHVSIPWWPDGRYRYELGARLPFHGELTRQPVTARSTDQPNRPRLELALASNRLIAGETLVGSCALFHIDDKKPREIELNLVPELELYGRGRTRERTGRALRLVYEMPAGSAGTSIGFRLPIPKTLTPSFKTASHGLKWWLIAKTGSFFGPSVEVVVPLQIVDRSAAARTPQLAVAPRLADQAVAERFAEFARTAGFLPVATPDGDDGPAIVKQLGDHALTLAYAYRGKAGTALVARLAHPSLGLDLSVVPGSTLRHAFFHDIEVDDAAWDRAHHVTARSADQAIPFLKQVVPALQKAAATKGCAFTSWDDDALVIERPITTLALSDLQVLAMVAEPIARAIAAAAPAIPPPPGVVVDVAAWRRLAKTLDTDAVIGELCVDGTLDGVAVGVALTWTADDPPAPHAIRVHVGDPVHASELLRRVALEVPSPTLATATLPEGVAEALARWPIEVRDLRVTDGVASAEVPIATDRVADATRALDLVRALRALLGLLDPGAGPYR